MCPLGRHWGVQTFCEHLVSWLAPWWEALSTTKYPRYSGQFRTQANARHLKELPALHLETTETFLYFIPLKIYFPTLAYLKFLFTCVCVVYMCDTCKWVWGNSVQAARLWRLTHFIWGESLLLWKLSPESLMQNYAFYGEFTYSQFTCENPLIFMLIFRDPFLRWWILWFYWNS